MSHDTLAMNWRSLEKPEYYCPVHGKTVAVIFVTITGKRERIYCVECWDEHLAEHLPILREKELDLPIARDVLTEML